MLLGSPFLYTGITFAIFNCLGTMPVVKERLIILAKGLQIAEEEFLINDALTKSCPTLFCCLGFLLCQEPPAL